MKRHRPPHIHPDESIIFLTGRIYSGISWLYSDKTKKYFYNKLQEILPEYGLSLDGYVICHNHYHLLLAVSQGAQVPKFIKHLHGSTAHYIRQHIPSLVTEYGQVLTREVTLWDKRQTARLNKEAALLERRLKSANTETEEKAVIAQFIARHPRVIAHFNARSSPRRLKSASTNQDVLAKFISHITDPQVLTLLASREPPIWYQYVDHVIRNEEDYYKHLNYIHQNPVKHGYVKKMTEYPWSSIHEWVKNKGKDFVVDSFRQYPIIDFQPIAD